MVDEIVDGFAALLPRATVTRGEVDRGGRELRWVEVAGTRRTVVFEAGSGATSLSWLPAIRELAELEDARLIAYDRVGIGASDRLAGFRQVSLATQVGDLIAVLEAASGTDGSCILVAHSWGGIIAQAVAWRRPELIAGLVFVDIAHEQVSRRMPRRALRRIQLSYLGWTLLISLGLGGRTLRADSEASVATWSEDADVRARLATADLAYYRSGRRVFAKLLGEMRTALRGSAEAERLRAAPGATLPAVPLVVLSADPEAAVGSLAGLAPEMAARHRELADQVPGARYELVSGSGHFIQLDRPEVVARAIREVLERADRDQVASGSV